MSSFNCSREFAAELAKKLEGIGIPAELNSIVKENGIKLEGIVFGTGNVRGSFYPVEENGLEAEATRAEEAYRLVTRESADVGSATEALYEWEKSRRLLRPYVVNLAKNRRFFESRNLSFEQFLDLAVGLKVELINDERGIMSTKVSKALLEKWGGSFEEARKTAFENLRAEGYVIEPLSAVLRCMMGGDMAMLCCGGPVYPESDERIYVCSNRTRTDGAVLLADTDILEEAGKKLGDFYLLPSSRHEFLIVPISGEMNARDLQSMVAAVNGEYVSDEDFLSNSVYIYRDGELKLVA